MNTLQLMMLLMELKAQLVGLGVEHTSMNKFRSDDSINIKTVQINLDEMLQRQIMCSVAHTAHTVWCRTHPPLPPPYSFRHRSGDWKMNIRTSSSVDGQIR